MRGNRSVESGVGIAPERVPVSVLELFSLRFASISAATWASSPATAWPLQRMGVS